MFVRDQWISASPFQVGDKERVENWRADRLLERTRPSHSPSLPEQGECEVKQTNPLKKGDIKNHDLVACSNKPPAPGSGMGQYPSDPSEPGFCAGNN